MKTLFISQLFLWITLTVISQVNPNYHRVEGYYRSNGTYVVPHYRTNPNSTINDNYSTKPNINPWTGEPGSIEPEYYDRGSLPDLSTSGLPHIAYENDWKYSKIHIHEMSTPEGRYWHQHEMDEKSKREFKEIEERNAKELAENGKRLGQNSKSLEEIIAEAPKLNIGTPDANAGKIKDISYSSPSKSTHHYPADTPSNNEPMKWGLGFLLVVFIIYMVFKE